MDDSSVARAPGSNVNNYNEFENALTMAWHCLPDNQSPICFRQLRRQLHADEFATIADELTLERWSPNGPKLPWWLWIISISGVASIIFEFRQASQPGCGTSLL
jgi:hypothetical protein